jgi:hypothetical protein
MKSLLLSTALALLGVGSASATVITATFTGAVTNVDNADGLFGNPSIGDSMIVSISLDYDSSEVSNSDAYSELLYITNPQYMRGSAIINGVSFVMPNPTNGYAQATDNSDPNSGNPVQGIVQYELDQNEFQNNGSGNLSSQYDLSGNLGSSNPTNPPYSASLLNQFSYVPTSNNQDFMQLAYSYLDPSTGQLNYYDLVSGTASLITVTISNGPMTAVPEPSTWAMLLLGFAGLGFVGYRRRNYIAT